MKSSFLAVFFLGVAVSACSGTGERGTTGGEGGEGGENPTTSTNSSSSSSSGMGGAGGNGMGGMGGAGGAAPGLSSDKLGQVCNPLVPGMCPMGYSCAQLLGTMATNGFCTLPCTGVTDTMTCSNGNGFPGPGLGVCNVAIQNQTGMFCGIVCGTQYNLPEMCPTGLTCRDIIDAATKMAGMDGKTDFCVP